MLWENTVIGTGETRYFVECTARQKAGSSDFRTLADAEGYFELMEAEGPRASRW